MNQNTTEEKNSRLWFVSDYHLGHANIIKYDKRPFSGINEMFDVIVQNHNQLVGPSDNVYFLGDHSWSDMFVDLAMRKMNGRFHITWGNHDKAAKKKKHLFASYGDLMEVRHEDFSIVCCHYPMRSWNKSHHGSWHLHGHCHNNLPRHGRSIDVCIAGHDYKPWSFEEVKQIMLEIDRNIEHHPKKDLVESARAFAFESHKGQIRKYNGTPYFNHPRRVAERAFLEGLPETVQAALYLHDVVEDCKVSLDTINKHFGQEVSEMVNWMTNKTKGLNLTRAERKKLDRERLRLAPNIVKIMKMMDRIDNLKEMKGADTDFKKLYAEESTQLMEVLKDASSVLARELEQEIANVYVS